MDDFFQSQNPTNQFSQLIPQFCDKCGTRYNQANIEFINNLSDRVTCKISCQNCGNAFVMNVNSPMPGAYAARRDPFRSEISANEIKKFMNFDRIRPDDIISVFDKLQKVTTIKDFNKLIDTAESRLFQK